MSVATMADPVKSQARYKILAMLFAITVINYADRAIMSLAGAPLSKELGIGPVTLGYLFSAFSWSYTAAQIPGGWMLDRYGSKGVYAWGIGLWSLFTLAQGLVGFFSGAAAITLLFTFRFLVGLAEAPSFPGNARIVAAWFPANERGRASAIFNSAQYFAPVIFAPLVSWITQEYGWRYAFIFMGILGGLMVLVWNKVIFGPRNHPTIGATELAHLEQGGALMQIDGNAKAAGQQQAFNWDHVRQLLSSRMIMGIYIGQYCIGVLTIFFLTWFPLYLVNQRGMSILKAGFVATLPALCGFIGGILGGIISDYLFKRTGSLTVARKTPIIIGMLLSMSIIVCNYVDEPALVVGVMALAFFGKGIGALGWAVVSDTSPKEIGGLSGGLFNTFGNLSAIVTPIAIGYIIANTGSFNGALVFVGVHAFLAMAAYLVIVGEIKRFELRKI